APACVLGHVYSHVFGHWAEELLKVVTLEKFGFAGLYVFPDWYPPLCREALHHLGVSPTRIMTVNKPVLFEAAFLTTTINHFNADKFPQAILHLRDRLYERAASHGAGPRVWVERGQHAKGRDIINKEEVAACV